MNLSDRFPASWRRRGEQRFKRYHYSGDDRRGRPAPIEAHDAGVLGTILVLSVLVWAAIAVSSGFGEPIVGGLRTTSLDHLLYTVVAVLGSVGAAAAFMRWRLTGEGTPLWIGGGLLLVGAVAAGVGRLLPTVLEDARAIDAVEPAGRLAAVAMLLAAAVGPAVDTRLSARRVAGLGVLVTGLLAVALSAVDDWGAFLTSSGGRAAFAVAWCGLALVHLVTARRRDSRMHLSLATAALVFALGEVGRVIGASQGVNPMATMFETVALALLLAQALRDLERAFCVQREQLLDTTVAVEAETARRRAQHAASEERAHDARNALLAIEGAATTLERYRDRLDAAQRGRLSEAVTAEIARLQQLVTAVRDEELVPFSLAELLAPVVTSEQARGLQIEVDVPGDLVSIGRTGETVEVVRNLLDNARRYAPGSPVTIRGEADGDWVVVFVEDRGRGIEREEREVIFERGQRGSASDGTEGSGIGLFVSRRLMVEQGGDLWVEGRPGGGSRFGLCLPLAPREAVELGAGIDVIMEWDEQAPTGGFRWDRH